MAYFFQFYVDAERHNYHLLLTVKQFARKEERQTEADYAFKKF